MEREFVARRSSLSGTILTKQKVVGAIVVNFSGTAQVYIYFTVLPKCVISIRILLKPVEVKVVSKRPPS